MVKNIINQIREHSRLFIRDNSRLISVYSRFEKSNKKGGVSEMKKVFSIALMVLVAGSISLAAQAEVNLYYDLSTIGLGQTGVFDRQTVTTLDATSTYALGMYTGASFSDVGDLQVGALTLGGPAVSNDQQLNTDWELTGHWDNLAGIITDISSVAATPLNPSGTLFSFKYTSGTAALYGDPSPDATFNGIGAGDDVFSTFTDGTQLAALSLASGHGTLFIPDDGSAPTGSTVMAWKITDVPTGVWFDPSGNDLETILEEYGYADVNTLVSSNVTIIPGSNGEPTQILSRNTGDVTYAVPEPTTMLLLGSGLLGLLGMVGIRRKVS